ncbi:hypothetical protein BUALT_Bualt02G0117200 [Buddleja alternifolia]|uniref:Uncharacterized protein n=1 Tax=Buddleja alternifolia TaxID=168488 RepID=A0AAV6Y3N7_9LAMI|nr:hypothetical protein BUALT_Bualt02G0117200 [Buddleja alternifolia]
MVVSDDSLELLAKSFPNFKSLVLVSCEGFTTDVLVAIASKCRYSGGGPPKDAIKATVKDYEAKHSKSNGSEEATPMEKAADA